MRLECVDGKRRLNEVFGVLLLLLGVQVRHESCGERVDRLRRGQHKAMQSWLSWLHATSRNGDVQKLNVGTISPPMEVLKVT